MIQKDYKTVGIIAGITLIFILCLVSLAGNSKSPEQLRLEAAMARIAAMKSDCEVIAKRVTDCFTSSSKTECQQMQESYAWFTSEYKESPDFACTTEPDPLAFGAAVK